MKTSSRVSSRTKLAEALGISAPTLYAYSRLPDSPPARNGYWYVSEWRKFVTKKRSVMETGEKQQLQLELLRAKLDREKYGLAESSGTVRQQILGELQAHFDTALQVIRTGFYRMRVELAPRFAGISAREIYKMWDQREMQLFDDVCRELRKRAGATITEKETRPASNIVPMREAAAG